MEVINKNFSCSTSYALCNAKLSVTSFMSQVWCVIFLQVSPVLANLLSLSYFFLLRVLYNALHKSVCMFPLIHSDIMGVANQSVKTLIDIAPLNKSSQRRLLGVGLLKKP